jgi:hypothetical protein
MATRIQPKDKYITSEEMAEFMDGDHEGQHSQERQAVDQKPVKEAHASARP